MFYVLMFYVELLSIFAVHDATDVNFVFVDNGHYGKTIRCRATDRTAKALICPAKVLPCVDARQRLRRQRRHCRAPDQTARQRPLPCARNVAVRLPLCRARDLYRARAPLPCGRSLPCAILFAVRHLLAVRLPLPAVLPLPCGNTPARTAKPPPGTPSSAPGAQVSSTWRLCHVYAHGKVTKSPLPCAYTRQRPLDFLFFFCFSLIPTFQNCISHISIPNNKAKRGSVVRH